MEEVRLLPQPEDVKRFLGMLLGRDVVVAIGQAPTASSGARRGLGPGPRRGPPRRPGGPPRRPGLPSRRAAPQPAAGAVEPPRVIAAYRRNDGSLGAVTAFDLPLSAAAAAALTLMPATGAKEAVQAGVLDALLQENMHEVLNVCASLFAKSDSRRVVLEEVLYPPQAPEGEIADAIADPLMSTRLDVSIHGYDAGQLVLYII